MRMMQKDVAQTNITQIVAKQRQFFATNTTKSVSYRLQALKRLKQAILKHEDAVLNALKQDLHKAYYESYMTEIGMVLHELRYMLKHTPRWAKQRRVKTPLTLFPAKSYVLPEPYGVVLIMSPWNYPFQLSLLPLIGAIAAGNCAVIKPSAYAPHVSHVIAKLVADCFPPEYVTVVEGGREENQALLDQEFDYIFFTGGVQVGKLVMEKAARHLTPVTLELGGKSPCIVDHTANLDLAAKRIVFGKLLNCGQTCVAPDYLLVDVKVRDQLIEYIKKYIITFVGSDPLENPDYPRIINAKHYQRLMGMLEGEQVIYGGRGNGVDKIEPTLVAVNTGSKLMQEEIFGPILPIMTYVHLHEVIEYINLHPTPLALYLFTRDQHTEQVITSSVSYGGGCINDTIIHLATPYLGFGGVGNSGMGKYHGYDSFATFSHYKSIVKRGSWLDPSLRYHPYSQVKERLMRLILK